jgi:hypothetical protein
VLAIRRRGEGLKPVMSCVGCGQLDEITKLWAAFKPPNGAASSEAVIVHRHCLDGRLEALMGTQQITLWKLVDALARMMRG